MFIIGHALTPFLGNKSLPVSDFVVNWLVVKLSCQKGWRWWWVMFDSFSKDSAELAFLWTVLQRIMSLINQSNLKVLIRRWKMTQQWRWLERKRIPVKHENSGDGDGHCRLSRRCRVTISNLVCNEMDVCHQAWKRWDTWKINRSVCLGQFGINCIRVAWAFNIASPCNCLWIFPWMKNVEKNITYDPLLFFHSTFLSR